MEKRRILSIGVIILLGIFLYVYFTPTRTMYYGWVEILDKSVSDDEYNLHGVLDESIDIVMNDSDSLAYEEVPGETTEISDDEAYNLIEVEEEYFVRIRTNRFRNHYTLEKLYGY